MTARAPLRRRLPSNRQVVVFGAAVTVLVLHATVAAPLTVIAAVVLAPGLVLLFQRSGRTMRTLLAGATGLATTFVGVAVYVGRVATGTADGADYTGVVAAAAGVALIGLAFTVALHRRRVRAKLLAIPAGLVLLQWFAAPLMGAALITNAARPWVPAAWTLQIDGARDVTFPATDGVRLAGWYVPGQTGATVILMHGSHGTRADTLLHLRTLTAAGYGVLAFDARGHGESAGRTNALGWRGTDDVAGAVAFLNHQGADPRRIAALGLSMGGEEALRAAAAGVPLAAVVADGAGSSTAADKRFG